MLVVGDHVSSLVHLYTSAHACRPQWREGNSYRPRFFAYVPLSRFPIAGRVTSDNLCSCSSAGGVASPHISLIGSTTAAVSERCGDQGLIVKRVGDFAWRSASSCSSCWSTRFGFDDVFARAGQLSECRRFLWMECQRRRIGRRAPFVGACGKSGQLFCTPGFRDAMEGPEPVSALIHAKPQWVRPVSSWSEFRRFRIRPVALSIRNCDRVATAFLCGTVGLVQNDIKRVIA